MGNLRWTYVLNALRAWAGDEGAIRELSLQFRAINHKNDVLTTVAKVTGKETQFGEHLVRLDVNVKNQDDVMTSPGIAVVVLPSRGT
jgi:hypothetical protein